MAPAPDAKRRALGKGLESLLPSRPAAPVAAPTVDIAAAAAGAQAGRPLEIPLEKIDRNPLQTRTHFDQTAIKELARSIAVLGVVQPISVRQVRDGRYQLIAGERRWLASFEAGKETVPALLCEVSDAQALEMTIVENLQRVDLNPMEQARAYQRLGDQFQMTQEQMATRTGKDRASVANFLRLLRLPEAVQAKVESGELSFGHARTLLALESPEQMQSAAQKVLALSMSVRQTESYINGLINPEAKLGKVEQQAAPVDPNVREAEDRLRRTLGLKVQIEDKRGKGKVIIEYSGLEDFDAILTALGGNS